MFELHKKYLKIYLLKGKKFKSEKKIKCFFKKQFKKTKKLVFYIIKLIIGFTILIFKTNPNKKLLTPYFKKNKFRVSLSLKHSLLNFFKNNS